MAVTRTRTRTQATLTFLATKLAAVNAELMQLQQRVTEKQSRRASGANFGEDVVWRVDRIRQLTAERTALYETIRQFDPDLDPSRIGGAT